MILKLESRERIKFFQIADLEFVYEQQALAVIDYTGNKRIVHLQNGEVLSGELYDSGVRLGHFVKTKKYPPWVIELN